MSYPIEIIVQLATTLIAIGFTYGHAMARLGAIEKRLERIEKKLWNGRLD